MAQIEKHIIYISDRFPLSFRSSFIPKEFSFFKKHNFNIHLFPIILPPHHDHAATSIPYQRDLLVSKWEKLKYIFSFESLALMIKEFRSNSQNGIRPNGIKVLRSVGIALHAKNKMKKFILQNNLDNCAVIIYSFWFTEVTFGLTLLRKEFPHIRFITRAHGGDLYPDQSLGGYLPFRFLRLTNCDKIVPCSENGRRFLIQDGASAENCQCVYLGTDSATIIAPYSTENELHIVSCSYISPVKRLSLLVASLEYFAKKHSHLNIVWHHLGGGENFHTFQAAVCEKLGAIANISYTLHGNLSNEDILHFLQGSATCPLDGLINVSSSEGLPVSMMEAMRVGLPILATDVGGVNELVTADTGILLPCQFTNEEFSNALHELMNFKSEEKRKKIQQLFNISFDAAKNYEFFIHEYIEKELDISKMNLLQNGKNPLPSL